MSRSWNCKVSNFLSELIALSILFNRDPDFMEDDETFATPLPDVRELAVWFRMVEA